MKTFFKFILFLLSFTFYLSADTISLTIRYEAKVYKDIELKLLDGTVDSQRFTFETTTGKIITLAKKDIHKDCNPVKFSKKTSISYFFQNIKK